MNSTFYVEDLYVLNHSKKFFKELDPFYFNLIIIANSDRFLLFIKIQINF